MIDLFSTFSTVVTPAFGRSINRGNYATVVIVVLVFIFGMVFVFAYGVRAARRKHQVETMRKLTSGLGLTFFQRGKRNETEWCAGKYQDSSLTMQGRTVTYRGSGNVNHSSSARMEVAYVIRLCLSVPEISAENVKIYRGLTFGLSNGNRSLLDSFDEAFGYKDGAENLPEALKVKLLEFVKKNNGALLLQDPSKVNVGHLPEGAFENGPMVVLIHEAFARDIKTDADKLREILDDLSDLAGAVKNNMG